MCGIYSEQHLRTCLRTYMAQVVLAELDCLLSLAACARDFELVQPTMTGDNLPTNELRAHAPSHSLRRRPLEGTLQRRPSLRLGTH